MTRFAKIPVKIPQSVEWSLKENQLHVKGAKGETSLRMHPLVTCRQEEDALFFVPKDSENKQSRAMAGTLHRLTQNMFVGVTDGFSKNLELRGVGYRVEQQGKDLKLSLGYSNPIIYKMPADVQAKPEDQTKLTISGIDKQRVGQIAAEIRSLRRPDPYKGKGVRYADEEIILKEAKKKK